MRLQVLHYIAKLLRIQFKVDGTSLLGQSYQLRPGSLSQAAQR